MWKRAEKLAWYAVFCAGAVALVRGCWMWSPAAAYGVGGVLGLVVGFLGGLEPASERTDDGNEAE